jgi:hypothetical protein
MLTVIVKLVVIVEYETSRYIMLSVCVPIVDESLEEKVKIGGPVLVETET